MASKRPNRQEMPKKKMNWFLKFLIFLLVCAAAFFGCMYYSYNYFTKYGDQIYSDDNIVIEEKDAIQIEVPEGSNTMDVAYLLKQKGLVESPVVFKLLSNFNGYDGKYKAGVHVVSKELNYDGLMRVLTSNPQAKPAEDLRIPEGFSYTELKNYLVVRGYNAEALDEVVKNPEFDYAFLQDLPDRDFKLEGYLYPDTYKMEVDWTEKQVINRLLAELDNAFTQEYYDRANELGMSVDQVITLASLIEMEAKYPKDKKLISSVFHNRLNSTTLRRLQSDVTIQYARILAGIGRTELVLHEDLKIDSPYNTYLHEVLPPGPICSPRKDSIEAALFPAETNYYYFFALADGTNIYNETFDGHINDQRKYGLIK